MTEDEIENVGTIPAGWRVRLMNYKFVASHPDHAPRWCDAHDVPPFDQWAEVGDALAGTYEGQVAHPIARAWVVREEDFNRHNIGDEFMGGIVIDGVWNEDEGFILVTVRRPR